MHVPSRRRPHDRTARAAIAAALCFAFAVAVALIVGAPEDGREALAASPTSLTAAPSQLTLHAPPAQRTQSLSAAVNLARACGPSGDAACPTQQSSECCGGPSQRAVDNAGFDGQWASASCTSTDGIGPVTWWRVDLEQATEVTSLTIVGRSDCCEERLDGYSIYVGFQGPESVTDSAACVTNQPNPPAGEAVTVTCERPIVGRYVYVYLGRPTILTLCEVEVFGERTINMARTCGADGTQACPASQSSTSHDGPAERAVDNAGFSGSWHSASCTHTDIAAGAPTWWRVDLEKSVSVDSLTVIGRSDCCETRTAGYSIYIGDAGPDKITDNAACVTNQPHLPERHIVDVTCGQPLTGRYVYFYLPEARDLTLCEVMIWEAESVLAETNPELAAAGGTPVAATLETKELRTPETAYGNGATHYLDRQDVDCGGSPISKFHMRTLGDRTKISFGLQCSDGASLDVVEVSKA